MAAPAVRAARSRRLRGGGHAAGLPALRRRRLRQLLPGAGGRGPGLGGQLQPLPPCEPRGDEAAARGSHRAAGHHQGPRGAQDAEHPAGAAQGVGIEESLNVIKGKETGSRCFLAVLVIMEFTFLACTFLDGANGGG
ncbi:uncharacterized protein LOC125112188 [Phacochoerus africanus]|uniref:uncharacterized protein LOC125112188 n=1 Tax=Phacochoerus africanus TaxID=41426 RepID=UPI001FDA91CF|nr:uncharacterized protein LOC125112188 [Phacochoerus africanus]